MSNILDVLSRIDAEAKADREKQKAEDEKRFIRFKKSEGQTVIDYMELLPTKDVFTENYLLFMKTLGKPITAELTTCTKAAHHFPDNIIGEICEKGCGCHEVTVLCAVRDTTLRPFFGFADEYRNGVYYQSACHSFLLSGCGKFLFDMKLQFEARQPWNRLTEEQTMDYLKGWVRNYFGVEIPFSIISEIYHSRTRTEKTIEYANHSWYIKNTIFTSREKTLQFIKRIQKLQGTSADYRKVPPS